MKKNKAAASETTHLSTPISHPDKVFWPSEGYTKIELAEYYNAIFPKLLPYVKDRILALERCPDGMLGECFFQKQKPRSMPSGTPTKRLEHVSSTGRFTDYLVGGSLVTQLALVNLGCIAVHVMGSRAISPRQPDWICIDIDPETGQFADAARAALQVKAALDVLKFYSYPKTSGNRGLHVLVPIRVGPDADQVLAFARSFVGRVASAHPDELTVEHSVAARGGRVYLDPFRNGFGQTVVAPYSVRRTAEHCERCPLRGPDRLSGERRPAGAAGLGHPERRLEHATLRRTALAAAAHDSLIVSAHIRWQGTAMPGSGQSSHPRVITR